LALWILLNNFLHDFSAAGWLFGSILLGAILKKRSQFENSSGFANSMMKTVLFLMNISVAGIVVFGIIRAVAYKSFEWSVEAGNGQLTLLVVKHVIFTVIFIAGLIQYLKALKIVKNDT
jgi:TRAP-type mannitol/chloroaromatic compound transport system permease small subunit